MSYPIDLDEYPESELRGELARRAARRAEGRCDYCGQPTTAPVCKFPERHRSPYPTADGRALESLFAWLVVASYGEALITPDINGEPCTLVASDDTLLLTHDVLLAVDAVCKQEPGTARLVRFTRDRILRDRTRMEAP